MPSKGLMIAGGIGNALSQGVDAFLKARGLRDEQEEREKAAKAREQQLGLLAAKEGMVYSPELGRYEFTPEGFETRKREKERGEAEIAYVKAHTAAENAKAKKLLGGAGGNGDGPRDPKTLAPDERAELSAIGTKAGNKRSIADQIDAVMGTWDTLPEDQKIAQGFQLLKILNSAEGADAVGEGEAKRLGAKIEFVLGLNPQRLGEFGRDLEGFATQARATSENLRTSSNASRARADEIMRRKPTTGLLQSAPPPPPTKPKPPWALR